MLKLYQQLVEKVYTEARSSSGSKAEHILKDFKFADLPKIMKDAQLIHKLPKKLEEKKKNTVEKSQQLRRMNEEKNRKIKDFESLFYLSYTNNNFVTLPFISSMDREFKLDMQQIKNVDSIYRFNEQKLKPPKLFLAKHEIIFETILQKLLGREVSQQSIDDLNQLDGSGNEVSKNNEDSVDNGIFLALIENGVKINSQITKLPKEKFYRMLYSEYQGCTKTLLIDLYLIVAMKLVIKESTGINTKEFVKELTLLISSNLKFKSRLVIERQFRAYVAMVKKFGLTIWKEGKDYKWIPKLHLYKELYDDLIVFQGIMEETIKTYYHDVCVRKYEQWRKSRDENNEDENSQQSRDGDEYDSSDNDYDYTCFPPKKKIKSILWSSPLKVDSGIDFNEAPDKLLKIVTNFLKFDGTAYINVIIEKNDQSKGGATKEQIDEMTDLMKISKLVKHSRKKKLKNGGPENVITILSYHKRYNYITANLLYEDSPAILCANFHLYNQESPFKAA